MQSQVVTVGIQLLVLKEIDAYVVSQLSPNFTAAQSHKMTVEGRRAHC